MFACVTILLFLLIGNVQAANQAEISSDIGSDGIYYSITQGETIDPALFHLWETTGEYSTQIKLQTNGLSTQDGTNRISAESIEITYNGGQNASQFFPLKSPDDVTIKVSIDTANAQPGMYTGKITVRASNATSMEIPMKVQISVSVIWPALFNFVGVILGFGFIVAGITIPTKNQGRLRAIRNAFSWEEMGKQWAPVLAFILMTIVVWAGAFVAYYPELIAFGSTPVDYLAAFLFGLGQVGAAKITADMFKLNKQ